MISNICEQLIDEFTPLSAKKGQDILLKRNDKKTQLKFSATEEALETIISILLMNAIQHSNTAPVLVILSNNQLEIINESKYCRDSMEPGKDVFTLNTNYGIGLEIAQRLAKVFNLTIKISFDENAKASAKLVHKIGL